MGESCPELDRPASVLRFLNAAQDGSFASSSKRWALALMPAMEVGQRELLVGPVQVIVVLAPAQQEGIDAELLLEQPDDRDRAAFADEDRLGAEARLDGPHRGPDARACRHRPAPPGAPWW